jgi:hypothetical protein
MATMNEGHLEPTTAKDVLIDAPRGSAVVDRPDPGPKD